MVKDLSDSERINQLPPHRLLFPISSKGSFICTTPTDRIAHTTAFVTPVVEHWLELDPSEVLWTIIIISSLGSLSYIFSDYC